MCEGITGPLSKIYREYGCNEGDVIVMALEGSGQSESSVQQFINHYNPSYPYVIGSDAMDGITATIKPTSVPTVRLIAPDRSILKTVTSDIKAIENILISEGVSKSTCTNNEIISDTVDGGSNSVNTNGWYAAVDNEGVGSSVIKDATMESNSIVTKMYVGPFSYPNGPWSSGKLSGHIGYSIKDYNYVKITYKSSIDLIFELPMPSLDSGGKNFGKRVDASNNFNTIILDLNTFEKPTWAVSDATPLKKENVTTVSFRTLLANGENVDISVKEVIFYKQSNTEIEKNQPNIKKNVHIRQFENSLLVNLKNNPKSSFKIYSVNGRVIHEGVLNRSGIINCVNLSSGLYVLSITSINKNEEFSWRFKWER